MRKRILVVFETSWDRPQLATCRAAWSERYELEFAAPTDHDAAWNMDVPAYVAEQIAARRGTIDGVLSTSDYPGATAAGAIATGLALPGTPAERVLRASHKYASRLLQREVVPEAVPPFALVDPTRPETFDSVGAEGGPAYPCFVKPVKGAFSVMSGVVRSRAELEGFVLSPHAETFRNDYLEIFDRLVRHYRVEHPGRAFLAEGLLVGRQATVEGWRTRDAEGVLGIVDSSFRPGTRSFTRFDYPSDLPPDVQQRMTDVALRAVRHIGLVDTLFNVEMIWNPESDRLSIVEVNPRACGQFADLYAKVDGLNSYELALALAAGDPPPLPREGAFRAAASFPLRVFEPVRILSTPDPERIAEIERAFPGTHVWLECARGDALTDFKTLEDGESARYGIANLGGASREDLDLRLAELIGVLAIEMTPVHSDQPG